MLAAAVGAGGAKPATPSPAMTRGSWMSTEVMATLAALLLASAFLLLWQWRARRQRMVEEEENGSGSSSSSSSSMNRTGSAAMQRRLDQMSKTILSLKEAGNRAYLAHEYEQAAKHFQQAAQETIAMCKIADPQLVLQPVALKREEEVDSDEDASSASSATAAPAQPTFPLQYPPPGQLTTRPNPHLALLPTVTSNNLAIFFSNHSACLVALNRYGEALAEAECAIHAQPLWSKGYLRAGQAYEGLGLFERAEAMYLLGAQQDSRDENVARCVTNIRTLQKEVADTRRSIEREEKRAQKEATASSAASSSAPSSLAPTDKFQRLTSWLLSHGAQFPYLYLKQYEHDHRGVHTLCRIAPNKILLEVPLRCILTSDLARRSKVGRALEESRVELASNHSFLACFLLEERSRGAGSFWQNYIDILPSDYENMPIFFREEDKQWLKGSFTLPKIAERHRELRMEYERICSKLDSMDLRDESGTAVIEARVAGPFSSRHSLSDFIWARSVVITRIFGFTMNIPSSTARGGFIVHKTDGLVPMADMLNHRRPRESAWSFDDARQGFVISSLVPFAPRQEVCDSYGRKCNSRFFINYGFCLPDNREDNQSVVWVRLDHTEAGEQQQAAAAAAATIEKRKKLLGIRGRMVEEKTAGTQTLSQSASSLSSSSFVLSDTPPPSSSAAAASSASAIPAATADTPTAYPPFDSLRFQLPADYSDRITREIFSLLRVVVASSTSPASVPLPRSSLTAALRPEMAELDAIETLLTHRFEHGVEYGLRNLPPIALRNELAVLQALREAATSALEQFDTTLKQDQELLARDAAACAEEEEARALALGEGDVTPPSAAAAASSASSSSSSPSARLTSNQRNCVLMRLGEKEVLQHYLSLADEVAFVVKSYDAMAVVVARNAVRSESAQADAASWNLFVQTVVEPRYSSGEGPFDLYITTVLLPLIQAQEEKQRKRKQLASQA